MAKIAASDVAIWKVMQDKLLADGWCQSVTIGEPESLAASDISGAILMEDGYVDETVLTAPREVHRVILRIYGSVEVDAIEEELEQVRASIWADIMGDFTLGGVEVDDNDDPLAYALPALCLWRAGYQEVGLTLYRILDLTIAYRVDDRAKFARGGTP